MATENDDSQPVEGILTDISRDVVDTSWDIPPLTFPKLQSVEADTGGSAEATSAEPRTVASSALTQTMPLTTDSLDTQATSSNADAMEVPTVVQEPASLPLLTPSTDSPDAEATQVIGTPDAITDLEELAKEDPEHDPLKIVPTPPTQTSQSSQTKKTVLGVIAAVAAVAVIAAGIIVVRTKLASREKTAAVSVCEKARNRYTKTNETLDNAIQQAAGAQALTASQVADATTLTTLNQAVEKAKKFGDIGGCSVLLPESVLRSHARDMSKQISAMKKQAAAVADAAQAVKESRQTLKVNNARTALQKAISDAQTLLDNSEGMVADESTREALAQAIADAQKLLDGKSVDVASMQNATKSLSSNSDSVNQSIEAQATANAQANTNNGTTTDGTTTNRYGNNSQYYPWSSTTGGLNGGNGTGGAPGDGTGGGSGSGSGGPGGSGSGGSSSAGGSGDSGSGSGASGNVSGGDSGGGTDSGNGSGSGTDVPSETPEG